jgi:hypothetical protein
MDDQIPIINMLPTMPKIALTLGVRKILVPIYCTNHQILQNLFTNSTCYYTNPDKCKKRNQEIPPKAFTIAMSRSQYIIQTLFDDDILQISSSPKEK